MRVLWPIARLVPHHIPSYNHIYRNDNPIDMIVSGFCFNPPLTFSALIKEPLLNDGWVCFALDRFGSADGFEVDQNLKGLAL